MQKEEVPIEVIYGKSTTASADSGCGDTNNGTKKEEVPIEIIYGKKDDGRDTTFEGREILQKPEQPMEIIYGKSDNNSIDNAGSSSDDDSDNSSQFENASEASSVNIDEGIKLDDDMLEKYGYTDLSTTASNIQKKIANSHKQLDNNGTHSMEAAYAKSDELTKRNEKQLTDMDKFHEQCEEDKERDPKAFNKRYGTHFKYTGKQFLVFNIDGNLLLAVARTLAGNVDGISGRVREKGTKRADDSLFELCGRTNGYPGTFPKEGFNRAGVFLIFEITGMSVKEIAQLIIGRVEEESSSSLLTLCRSVLSGAANFNYSISQLLDKLVSEADKHNTTYQDLKSRLPTKNSNQYTNADGSTLHHIWVYTLTAKDKKGDSLYGVMTSSRAEDISKCIGGLGGRGSKSAERQKDNSFNNIEVGSGREWKNSRGGDSFNGFWVEKKEAKPDEWYKVKRITVARPASWYKKKGIRVVPPPDFSTVQAKPLRELDLTD